MTPALDGPDATSPAIHLALNSQGPACLSPDRPSNQSSHYSSSSPNLWPASSSLLLQLLQYRGVAALQSEEQFVGGWGSREGGELRRVSYLSSYGDGGGSKPSSGGSAGCGPGGYQAKQPQSPAIRLLALPFARRSSHEDSHCARAF